MYANRSSADNLAATNRERESREMTWIEATCPTCGAVEVTPKDIELGICTNHGSASYYSFTCPVCTDHVQKKAEDRVVELLISEGVRPSHWSIPAESLEEHFGPAITSDDVLDMVLLLERDDWYDQLLQTSR
jgi:hypothetical protein